MRHNKKFNHLGRTSSHRKAMLSNMASSLIESKRITTTLAKAKALRTYVEPLITRAKEDTTHSRRVVFSHLQNKEAVSELFRDIATKIADRPGGYTRILRTGNRLGDNAEMCIIELVDYNEAMLASKTEAEKPKRKRSRRGGAKKQLATAEDKPKSTKEKTSKSAVAESEAVQTPAQTEVSETAETPADEVVNEQVVSNEAEEQKDDLKSANKDEADDTESANEAEADDSKK
ncbi:MAG: 50S ribosomal protein L17 [Bacteroidales bacterium]|jgi:large subunit ribosomal protein L17|nr:50S ribosomal protein L17 [Bacteroidales bacterium]